MKTVCEKNLCNGCHACVSLCPQKAIAIQDTVENLNAIIDETKCVKCNSCYKVCPRNDDELDLKEPIAWYQGWAEDPKLRSRAASGGAAGELMSTFIRKGGYVCSCTFQKGEFSYFITNDIKDIGRYAGSKYVKSNPGYVYREVRKLIASGACVLFVGLPCHVAAVRKYVGTKEPLLYTVDLICHGTPSVKVLEKYLRDRGYSLDKIADIRFRAKNDYRANFDGKPIVTPGVADRYLYTFLKKINYTENCYQCQFARTARISDITIGDSWGSNLPMTEQEKGISLFLVQTEKGKELLEKSRMVLYAVDRTEAVSSNNQLRTPADKPAARAGFMEQFKKGKKYGRIVFKLAPTIFIRQDIKWLLYHFLRKTEKSITYTILIKK